MSRPADPARTAVVTGASRGLGRAIAVRLGRTGAHVVAVARTTSDLARTDELVVAAGGSCSVVTADVTDRSKVDRLVKRVADERGTIDVLVNNAGRCLRGSLDAVPAEDYDAMIAVNVSGVLNCSYAVWPVMRANGGGVIVNLSSLASTYLTREFAVYAATKAFVETLTRALAEEGRRAGIRVCAVAAGYARTDMFREISPDVPDSRALDPDEVADVVVDLCSSRYARSSGTIVRVQR